jgi:hypothetical protein
MQESLFFFAQLTKLLCDDALLKEGVGVQEDCFEFLSASIELLALLFVCKSRSIHSDTPSVDVQEEKGKRPHPPWFAYVLAIKTFGAGSIPIPVTEEIECLEASAISGFFTGARRTEGMQA